MGKLSSLQSAGRVWVAFVLIVLLVLIAVILGAAQRSRKMSSDVSSSTAQPFSQASPGSKTKLVMEVEDQATDGTFSGKLLNPQDEQTYARTAAAATIKTTANTRYVMGKPSDLRKSAVIHVTGTLDSDHRVQAEQIVILTGYVRVH